MVFFISFLLLVAPFAAEATPVCGAGYILNQEQRCELRWEVSRGHCAIGSYQDAQRRCVFVCPYRSELGLSSAGDYVCLKNGRREWLQQKSAECRRLNLRYQLSIDSCIGSKEKEQPEEEKPQHRWEETCASGKAMRVVNGAFRCVAADIQALQKNLKKKLESDGLTYVEYVTALKDMQTNRLMAELLHHRWQEVTGKRQTPEQKRAYIKENTQCPEQYRATEQGGCTPVVECSHYSCPEGQKSMLVTRGKAQYCECRATTQGEPEQTPQKVKKWWQFF